MAVERRVKPSARAKQMMAEKRKIIIIALAAVLVIALVITFAVTILPSIVYNEPMPWEKDTPSSQGSGSGGKTAVENPDAIKAMLEQTVSYTGTWNENTEVGYQVYVPGTEYFEYKDQVSDLLYKNEAGTAIFGVVHGSELTSLGDDATLDPQAVLEATVNRITPDISEGLYGASFSPSYDVSNTLLGDKTPAILITGDLTTKLGLQPEGGGTVTEATYNYPLCGVAFVRNNIPVMVWGVVDSDDAGEAYRLPTYIEECARIISSITVDTTGEE